MGWNALGMKTEAHYKDGGHCQNIPFNEIVQCLDDDTKRLLPHGFSPAPPSPAPPPGPSPGGNPPATCQTCFKMHCGAKLSSHECTQCLKDNQRRCASSCMPYPFGKAIQFFCGRTTAER